MKITELTTTTYQDALNYVTNHSPAQVAERLVRMDEIISKQEDTIFLLQSMTTLPALAAKVESIAYSKELQGWRIMTAEIHGGEEHYVTYFGETLQEAVDQLPK